MTILILPVLPLSPLLAPIALLLSEDQDVISDESLP
jgi:hypothetical protein